MSRGRHWDGSCYDKTKFIDGQAVVEEVVSVSAAIAEQRMEMSPVKVESQGPQGVWRRCWSLGRGPGF